ncbi:MAG: hypothetical protein OEZ58_10665 [Gammaproteobacteria bacterium]|nr:hypothetical protein [Gammaproteobacteria bacterium]
MSVSLNAQAKQLELQFGQRYEYYYWSISHLSGTPNIISELTWSEVIINYAQGLVLLPMNGCYNARLNFLIGNTTAGETRDSDYGANNREQEFSRSYLNVSGKVYEFGGEVQCQQQLMDSAQVSLYGSVVFGLFAAQQQRRMTEGMQAVSSIDPGFGLAPFSIPDVGTKFVGLDSYHHSTFAGTYTGLRSEVWLSSVISLQASGLLFLYKFDGDAHWNLRNLHFTQQATGFGWQLGVDAVWHVNSDIKLKLSMQQREFHDRPGDEYFFTGDDDPGYTIFNGSHWVSSQIGLGLNWRF